MITLTHINSSNCLLSIYMGTDVFLSNAAQRKCQQQAWFHKVMCPDLWMPQSGQRLLLNKGQRTGFIINHWPHPLNGAHGPDCRHHHHKMHSAFYSSAIPRRTKVYNLLWHSELSGDVTVWGHIHTTLDGCSASISGFIVPFTWSLTSIWKLIHFAHLFVSLSLMCFLMNNLNDSSALIGTFNLQTSPHLCFSLLFISLLQSLLHNDIIFARHL